MEEEVAMEKEEKKGEKIDYLFKEFMGEKYYKLDNSVIACTIEMKDLKISFELFRREIAIGFVPRATLDLYELNVQAHIVVLEQKLKDLKDEIRESQQKAISTLERIWLHVGSVGVIIGVAIVVLEYLQRVH